MRVQPDSGGEKEEEGELRAVAAVAVVSAVTSSTTANNSARSSQPADLTEYDKFMEDIIGRKQDIRDDQTLVQSEQPHYLETLSGKESEEIIRESLDDYDLDTRLEASSSANNLKATPSKQQLLDPLLIAVKAGDLDEAKRLIESKTSSPKKLDKATGCNVLQLACLHGHLKLVEYLHSLGLFDINQYDANRNSFTALHYACQHGDVKLVMFLVREGADVSLLTGKRQSAFILAARKQHYNVLKYFLVNHHVTDVNSIYDTSKETPLIYSIGHFPMTRLLLQHGAVPDSFFFQRLQNIDNFQLKQEMFIFLREELVNGQIPSSVSKKLRLDFFANVCNSQGLHVHEKSLRAIYGKFLSIKTFNMQSQCIHNQWTNHAFDFFCESLLTTSRPYRLLNAFFTKPNNATTATSFFPIASLSSSSVKVKTTSTKLGGGQVLSGANRSPGRFRASFVGEIYECEFDAELSQCLIIPFARILYTYLKSPVEQYFILNYLLRFLGYVQLVSELRSIEEVELQKICDVLRLMIEKCFFAQVMNDENKVLSLLIQSKIKSMAVGSIAVVPLTMQKSALLDLGSERVNDEQLENEETQWWVKKLLLHPNHLLSFCVQYRIPDIFMITQVHLLLKELFWKRITPANVNLHRYQFDLPIRNIPGAMFCLEFVLKCYTLCLIAITSVGYSQQAASRHMLPQNWHICECLLLLQVLGHAFELLGKLRSSSESIYKTVIQNDWMVLNVVYVTIACSWMCLRVFVSLWIVSTTPENVSQHSMQSVSLACRFILHMLAIPCTWSLLYYGLLSKTIGKYLLILHKIIRDVLPLLSIYAILLVGFTITLHGMFSESNSHFFNFLTTALFLFTGTLTSNIDFSQFEETSVESYSVLGILIFVAFLVLTTWIMMYYCIGLVTTSYQTHAKRIQKDWYFMQAKLTQQYLLITERNCFDILPAPLNLIPILCSGFGYCSTRIGKEEDLKRHASRKQLKNWRSLQQKTFMVSLSGNIANQLLVFLFNGLFYYFKLALFFSNPVMVLHILQASSPLLTHLSLPVLWLCYPFILIAAILAFPFTFFISLYCCFRHPQWTFMSVDSHDVLLLECVGISKIEHSNFDYQTHCHVRAAGSDSKGEKDVPLACMNVPNFANDMLFSNEDILQILSPLMQEKSVVSEEFHLQQIEHLQETMREKFEDFEGKHRETLYELQEMKQLLAQLVRRK